MKYKSECCKSKTYLRLIKQKEIRYCCNCNKPCELTIKPTFTDVIEEDIFGKEHLVKRKITTAEIISIIFLLLLLISLVIFSEYYSIN
jgi:hypothetical protein